MLIAGVMAMLLHLLTGAGLVRAGIPDARGFVPELCTNHGIAQPGATNKLPQAGHDCCELCAAGAPPMLPASATAVSPAPTLVDLLARKEAAAPNAAFTSAHRPRGPPAPA